MKILIMNGPNLNMLGIREPDIYGSQTLSEINEYLIKKFEYTYVDFEFFQSNFEGELIEKIHDTQNSDVDAIVFNPGAHTHYSYALRDAISSVSTPVIEVHLSEIKSREAFRAKSVIAPACEWQISGKGKDSYAEAIEALINNEGDIFSKRLIKTDAEIEKLREAQKIADQAFIKTLSAIKVGMTELEIADFLENNLYDNGAEALSFPTIVGSGENGADPHAVPSKRLIEMGDSIVIDFGIKHQGVCSDTTRTVFVGMPRGVVLRAWKAVLEANEQVEKAIRPGFSCQQAHDLAISVLDEFGFANYMPHGLGHGVGRDIHEKPILSPRGKEELEVNNVITVEPGVYVQEKFGIRLEDCGCITNDGFDSFTNLSHEMIVI